MRASFVRELLLGPDAVRQADRRAIGRYFAEVVADRGFPLHVTSLWNALYFGWDTASHGYLARSLNPDRIEERSLGATDTAVPVGAFVRVRSGANEAWGEVVYKEGRHPDAGDGGGDGLGFPAAASGGEAPLFGDPPRASLREALVIDWRAFGPDWNEDVALERLRRRGRLDPLGHLVMTALYDDGEAELDDAAFFAAYLLRHHRDGLLGEFVEAGAPDDELYGLLLQSLASIVSIIDTADGLVRNAHYVISQDDYHAVRADASPSSVFGAPFLDGIAASVMRVPGRERVAYTATGAAVLERLGRGGGLDANEALLLDGPGYGRVVTYANLTIAARLASIRDGLLPVADGPVHVRRDDAWQWGGVWRAERVDRAHPPGYVRIPPLIPLGLGARSAQPAQPTEQPARAADEVVLEPDTRTWRSTLTAADLDEGTLAVGGAHAWLGRLAGTRFRLKVMEAFLPFSPFFNDLVALDPRTHRIAGVEWGAEVLEGMFVYCSVGRDGSTVWAELRRLERPETWHGVRYEFEFDHGRRSVPGARMAAHELRDALSFREVVSRALRARGHREDGSYLAPAEVIASAIGGRDAAAALLSLVVAELRDMGAVPDRDGCWRWAPQVTRRTRSHDTTVLHAAATDGAARLARHVRGHVVRMHLRRWEHADYATWERRAAEYARAVEETRAAWRLGRALPPGHTWVREHEVSAF